MKTKVTRKKLFLALSLCASCFGFTSRSQEQGSSPVSETSTPLNKMIELRSYNLKPGTRAAFNKLFLEEALPMLKRWSVDVVAFGPSLHDEDSYFLIRGYKDLEDRRQREDAFYGSNEWKNGPREAILALIENYTTVVIPAESITLKIGSTETLALERKSQPANDREQLSALNAQFIKNFITNDTASHNQIIHKDFVYISSSGKIVKREDYMKAWAHGYDPKIDKSFVYKDEVIRIFGNMALVRANTFFSRLEGGKIVNGKTVYTDTYVKENGRWLCVQAQITDVH
jgi:hypothetical protein